MISENMLLLILFVFNIAFITVGIIIARALIIIKKEKSTNINNIIESSFSYLNKKINSLEEKIIDSNNKSEQSLVITSKMEQNYDNHENFIQKLSGYIKILIRGQIGFIKNLAIITDKLQELEKIDETIHMRERVSESINHKHGFSVDIPRLTPTEMTVLKVLATSGSKSASEIREVIGKTREHSARLMKKLFLEGYIQRDTSTIPYNYKINESIKESMEFSTKNSIKEGY